MANSLDSGLTNERFGAVRRARAQVEAELPEDILSTRLEKGQTKEKAYEQYPHGVQLEQDARRAEIRRRVSEVMFEADQQNPNAAEREATIDRQINRYYDYEINNPKIHGHVEAPHGIKPSHDVVAWCDDKKVVSYEYYTAPIAGKAVNRMVFSRPRLFADVNHLPVGVASSLRSEGAVYTKEDNLNAVKAQRDLTGRILQQTDNIDQDGKAINPHLAIYLHGKVDTRGHDFEIGARQRNEKGPIDPRLAFWLADRLKTKVAQKDLKNSKGVTPTVNVVTYAGAYSGSPALTRMRTGDDVLGFKGFGEMLQCMQLECSSHLRREYPDAITGILNEIMAAFSEEFKTSSDLQKLDSYAGKFEDKMALEKADLFNVKNLGFNKEIKENAIALSATLREELEVENGDKVKVNGQEFDVTGMQKADLKVGKTMMLNPQHAELVNGVIIIEKM